MTSVALWKNTGARLLYHLPNRMRWFLADSLAFVAWNIFRFRRFTLLRNVTIVFPNETKEERIRILKDGLSHTAYNFFEVLAIPEMGSNYLHTMVEIHGQKHLDEARALGKGVLGLCLHIGNGDYAASVLQMKGYPTSIISKRFRVKFWDNLWFGLRGAHGVQYIEAHSPQTAFEILKRGKRNEIIAFVLDQFMGRPYAIPSRFCGRMTGTAYGLAVFDLKMGAPVIPIWNWRERETGKFHVCIEPPVICDFDGEDPKTLDKDTRVLRMTENYNRVIESIIRKRPEQWMWFHRRWKRYE